MSILKQVQEALANSKQEHVPELNDALVEAERLSDQFSEIKPSPYIVPIERFAGLSACSKETS